MSANQLPVSPSPSTPVRRELGGRTAWLYSLHHAVCRTSFDPPEADEWIVCELILGPNGPLFDPILYAVSTSPGLPTGAREAIAAVKRLEAQP